MSEAQILNDTVIKNGFCIGCGACALAKESPFQIEMDEFGCFRAKTIADGNPDTLQIKVLGICPFSGLSLNESQLSEVFMPDAPNKSNKIGCYFGCYAGFVEEDGFRVLGSSGGFGKWIGKQLLLENEIDYFIQLKANDSNQPNSLLFDYEIFNSPDGIKDGSKSAYYPTTLVNILKEIEKHKGRYAITGVPCFIKAIRLLANANPVLKERIRFTIGIVCGGMKSANHSKMVAWELGVHPDKLLAIDFRRKYKDRPATQKIYQVWSNNDNKEFFENANNLFGTDYGSGFFKPKACDYCDDVVAETADVSFGDAWLPQYRNDPKGTSLIIVRNAKINQILLEAQNSGLIHIERISEEDTISSQSGGFRHRREGLAYRLAKHKESSWLPLKRVEPNIGNLSYKRQRIYDLRETIAAKSHFAFLGALQKNNLDLFLEEMAPIEKQYQKLLNEKTIIEKIQAKINRLLPLVTK